MSIFNTFPKFDLGIAHLREMEDSDAPAYFEYMTSSAVSAFLTDDNIPKTHTDALGDVRYWKSLFPSRHSIFWGIALKETNELIGSIGFNSWNKKHGRSEISYDLSSEFWGMGIMTKAMQQIFDFAKTNLQMRRIQATVVTSNQRSIKLLEKLDFAKEGVLRQYEVVNDLPADYYLYSIIL
ncbi:MAG: GNAT family protein [Pseudomonadota bacterium]